MPVVVNIGQLVTCAAEGAQANIDIVHDGAVAWQGERIAYAGPRADLPAGLQSLPTIDAGGRLVVPGLVDCHTHLGFGGWRAHEFERRLRGESYQDIARAGGGIASTVAATRALEAQALYDRCRGFLAEMASLGVTCVEAKSGYGLTLESELRILEVYRALDRAGPQHVVPTFLGAHTAPPERRHDREGYVREVIEVMLPAVARAGLARCCDVFVEEGAFTVEQARRIFTAATALGLRAKLHADQLSDGGGAALAAEVAALSADHLEHTGPSGFAALARAGVVAVSLPIASLYLGQRPAPARALIDAGVAVAVATDFNPGSAPSLHLPLAMTLACTMQRMTPAEALAGATQVAARALGLSDRLGALRAGWFADLAVIDAPDVSHWLYHFRANACVLTVARGQTIFDAGVLGKAGHHG